MADHPDPVAPAPNSLVVKKTPERGRLLFTGQWGSAARVEYAPRSEVFMIAKLPGFKASGPKPVLSIRKHGRWAPVRSSVYPSANRADFSLRTPKKNGSYTYRVRWGKPSQLTGAVRLRVRATTVKSVLPVPGSVDQLLLAGDGSTLVWNGNGALDNKVGGLFAADRATGTRQTLLATDWVSVDGVSDNGRQVLYTELDLARSDAGASYVIDRTTLAKTALPSTGVTGSQSAALLSGNGGFAVLNDYHQGSRQRVVLFDLTSMTEAAVIVDHEEQPYLQPWRPQDITPDGRFVVLSREIGRDSQNNGTEIAIWDRNSGTLRSLGKHSGYSPISSLSADGSRLLVASGSTLTLWDLTSGLRRKLPLYAVKDTWTSAWLSADGTKVVVNGGQESLGYYTIATNTLTLSAFNPSSSVDHLNISDDGRSVAALVGGKLGVGGRLAVWSPE